MEMEKKHPFSQINSLIVGDTSFLHKVTWRSPDRKYENHMHLVFTA